MIKTNAKASVQKTAAQLELELEKLQKEYDGLKAAFMQLSNGKIPEGLFAADDGQGGGGGGGASEFRDYSVVTLRLLPDCFCVTVILL